MDVKGFGQTPVVSLELLLHFKVDELVAFQPGMASAVVMAPATGGP
jgi:hypothetical protein